MGNIVYFLFNFIFFNCQFEDPNLSKDIFSLESATFESKSMFSTGTYNLSPLNIFIFKQSCLKPETFMSLKIYIVQHHDQHEQCSHYYLELFKSFKYSSAFF